MSEMIVAVQTVDGEARIDSRELARVLGNQHKNVLGLIDDYQAEFEEFGPLSTQTRVRAGQQISGGGRPERYIMLNENQCYFLLTLVRNSEAVVQLKLALVKAFAKARELAARAAPALPTDPVELLALSLQGLQQHKRQIAALEERLNTAPVRMDSQKRARVYAGCQAFAKVHPRGYSGAYRAFKEAFGFQGAPLAAYDDLPQHRFDEALIWLDVQTRTFGAQRPLMGGEA